MNRAFQVVIGVSVILLVIMLSIFFKGSAVTESQVATAAPPPTAKSAATPEAKPKTKAQLERRRKAREAEAEPEMHEPEIPVMTVTVEVPSPPFPAAADVKAGMTREEMIGKFGTPRVAASWAENGYLAEKFIYTRDAQVTAVMLLDGEVVRSRTGRSHQPVGLRRAGP
jgi:hypothetical protein